MKCPKFISFSREERKGRGAKSWHSTPIGIRRFLRHITTVLFPAVNDIVVSEFGFGEPFEGDATNTNMLLWDLRRVDYYRSYLDEILASREIDKVNVTGIFGWSVCEWFTPPPTSSLFPYTHRVVLAVLALHRFRSKYSDSSITTICRFPLLHHHSDVRQTLIIIFTVDNFEWFSGTRVRFGMQYLNYTSLERVPKASMFQFLDWFK